MPRYSDKLQRARITSSNRRGSFVREDASNAALSPQNSIFAVAQRDSACRPGANEFAADTISAAGNFASHVPVRAVSARSRRANFARGVAKCVLHLDRVECVITLVRES